jgi:hypothetical protein
LRRESFVVNESRDRPHEPGAPTLPLRTR